MSKISKQEQIAKLMKNLGCTEAEALDIWESDNAIDRDEAPPEDLTAEQKKAIKAARSFGERKVPTAYKFDKKPRKANEVKRNIIDAVKSGLAVSEKFSATDIEVTNPEKEILFKVNNEWYSISLTYRRNMNKSKE